MAGFKTADLSIVSLDLEIDDGSMFVTKRSGHNVIDKASEMHYRLAQFYATYSLSQDDVSRLNWNAGRIRRWKCGDYQSCREWSRLNKAAKAFEVWCEIGMTVLSGPWKERHENTYF